MATLMTGVPAAKPMDNQSPGGLKFKDDGAQPQGVQPQIIVEDEAAPPVQPAGDDAAAGIAALKQQIADRDQLLQRQNSELESAHRGRVEAENRARAQAREADTSRASATDAEHTAILNGLTSAQAEASALESEFAQLMADGKFKEAGALQAKLGRVGARIETLEAGKTAIEAAKKAPAQQPVQSESEQREAFLAQQHPANAAWIRQNVNRFFTDPAFREKAAAASQYAAKVLNLTIGTPEYFQHVDEATGIKPKVAPAAVTVPVTPVAPGPTATPAEPLSGASAPVVVTQPQQPVQRQRTYAAPPSGGTPRNYGNGGSLPGEIRMTETEIKFCEDNDLNPVSYWQEREKLKKEGRWGNNGRNG